MSSVEIIIVKVLIIISLIFGGFMTYKERHSCYDYWDYIPVFIAVSVLSFLIMSLFLIIVCFMVS